MQKKIKSTVEKKRREFFKCWCFWSIISFIGFIVTYSTGYVGYTIEEGHGIKETLELFIEPPFTPIFLVLIVPLVLCYNHIYINSNQKDKINKIDLK